MASHTLRIRLVRSISRLIGWFFGAFWALLAAFALPQVCLVDPKPGPGVPPTSVILTSNPTTCQPVRPELMRPVLAFRIQELAYGGHSPETEHRLKQIAQSLRPDRRGIDEAHNRFKSGTRIIRAWGGKTYEVTLSPDGHEFQGKLYKSLSPIACEITGTRWSDRPSSARSAQEPASDQPCETSALCDL